MLLGEVAECRRRRLKVFARRLPTSTLLAIDRAL
jgi:hypothetical protein